MLPFMFQYMENIQISRDTLLNQQVYRDIHQYIPDLKKSYSNQFNSYVDNNGDLQTYDILSGGYVNSLSLETQIVRFSIVAF